MPSEVIWRPPWPRSTLEAICTWIPGWQFNWLKFSLEKPLEFWLEFWLEFPLDSTEEKGPF